MKCDCTRAETRFRLSAKRTTPFKSAGASVQFDYWQPRCAHQLLLLVVMLDTPCSEVVRRVLATHSIRQFPLHFLSRASPCAITFQLESTRVILVLTYTHTRALRLMRTAVLCVLLNENSSEVREFYMTW